MEDIWLLRLCWSSAEIRASKRYICPLYFLAFYWAIGRALTVFLVDLARQQLPASCSAQ